ncbi:MAG: oligosaccharide flippase family protein [Prevotella sp.]|nr:oligosaccharide flippase family protein [Prevotella sp.]
MANIKRNLMYSTVLTMSTYLVPLIVFPYISRVLGVEGIGIVDTVDNMIDYCILFSMMGLSSVGVREIAKNKDNPQALSQTFTDLFALNLCSTLLIAVVFCGVVLMSPRLQDYGLLIPIGILKLTANLFWIEWLYTGLEDFRYITLRSIILRTAFIIAVFLFVQTKADVVTYYALFVGITVGNAVCNWYHKRTYLHWDIRRANIRRFLVPFFMLGIFAMLSAVYAKLSLPVLNFITNNQEAGNFATATRVYRVVIALVSTLTGVMIPRMSVLMEEDRFDMVRHYTDIAFKLLFLFALPLICFVELFAPDIIRLFAGPGFEGAILPMRITMFQLLVIGSEKIIVLQLLIPLRKDRTIVKAGLAGVVVWGILTVVMVPSLQSVGTSLVWVAAELVVLIIAAMESSRSLFIRFPFALLLKSVIYALPYLLMGALVLLTTDSPVLRILVSVLLFAAYAVILEDKVYQTGIIKTLKGIFSR